MAEAAEECWQARPEWHLVFPAQMLCYPVQDWLLLAGSRQAAQHFAVAGSYCSRQPVAGRPVKKGERIVSAWQGSLRPQDATAGAELGAAINQFRSLPVTPATKANAYNRRVRIETETSRRSLCFAAAA